MIWSDSFKPTAFWITYFYHKPGLPANKINRGLIRMPDPGGSTWLEARVSLNNSNPVEPTGEFRCH